MIYVFLALIFFPYDVWGDNFLFPSFNELPIEIESSSGIEWLRSEKRYQVRGSAVAKQGDMMIHADSFDVFYDDSVSASADVPSLRILRLEAFGDLRIQSASGRAYATTGVYDVVSGRLILSGDNVRIYSRHVVLHASETFTYWRDSLIGVAEGFARIERLDASRGVLQGDTLVGRFERDALGVLALEEVEAYGDVLVSDDRQQVSGAYGYYDVPAGVAEILGDVEIFHGEQYLRGEHAHFDFHRGVSRLISDELSDSAGERVRGVIDLEDAEFLPREDHSGDK